jgi:magnesium transporter
MIFLSQLINSPIIDSQQQTIGRLRDIVVEPKNKDYPLVKGIIFQYRRDLAFIPYSYIENLSRSEITLTKSNCWKINHEFSSDEIFLERDILDQQIFDVKGIRVVRVNDLQLVKIEENFHLVGIDVSNKALFRRLGVSELPFFRSSESKFIDWYDVNFIKGTLGSLKLKTPYQNLKKLHPADIANLIENLTLHESSKLVQAIDKETAAEVLGEVEPEYKDPLLEHINAKELAGILEKMPTDEAADVIQDLSEHKRLQVFHRLGIHKAKMLHKLTVYEEDKAGGLMSSDYLAVPSEYNVTQTIKEIRRKSKEHESLYHVFALNKNEQLMGVVSIRTLLLAHGRTKIKDLMSKVVRTVRPETSAEEVAHIMTKYNLLSLAVVDSQKKMKGIITVDDIMRLLVPNA